MSRRKFLYIAGGTAGVLAAPGVGGMIAGRKGVEINETREDSLWTAEAPAIHPAPKLDNERKVDLAIIGSGYTGLSCAYYARRFRADWSVIVLESNKLGSGASSRNSGAVSARYSGLGKNEMTRRGFERLSQFIEEEKIDCDFRPCPVIEFSTSRSGAEKERASLEPGTRWVSAEELKENKLPSRYFGAVETGNYWSIDPAKLVAGHVEAARRAGVELYENSPVLGVRAGNPAELITPLAKVRADNVFIATNAYTPRLGFLKSVMMPVHQYTLATRKLTDAEIAEHRLNQWTTRFERTFLPVTTHLMPSGHFFIRIVLGYASFNSCQWHDMEGARKITKQMFVRRYPWIADVELPHGWHGVTGHTLKQRELAYPVLGSNVHVSAAYNGLGVMPGHNNGYLSACRITGHQDDDMRYLAGAAGHYPLLGEFYRSIMFKPLMRVMRS